MRQVLSAIVMLCIPLWIIALLFIPFTNVGSVAIPAEWWIGSGTAVFLCIAILWLKS